jgi:hypothetical protein
MPRTSFPFAPGALSLLTILLTIAGGCAQDPEEVGSNCGDESGCVRVETPLQVIDAVDILMVIDSSGSLREEAEGLKSQLPRLLNAIVTGVDEEASFPPASSVHVAVASSDLGTGGDLPDCEGVGDDGIFIRPGRAELSCGDWAASWALFIGYSLLVLILLIDYSLSKLP